MPTLLRRVVEALASFWLAITVLSFLLLLTLLGTLEQTRTSLFEVQQKYFESAFVVHEVAGIPVPLPGVYLLLVVLFVNLLMGGIVRMRKDRSTWGVLVIHLGIVVMLAGAAVEYEFSQKGHATIAEGSETAEFQSYYEWEIAIAEAKQAGPVVEHVIPGERFMGLAPGERATFTSSELPFDLEVHDVFANCEPQPGSRARGGAPVIDDVALVGLPRNKEAERDVAGAYVVVKPRSGMPPQSGILWAQERFPMSATVDGRRWTIGLSHRRWTMPFTVVLEDFRRELHAGTSMAKAFESDVTKVQAGVPQKVRISMNSPLRQDGYTLYQSGFQEPSSWNGGRWYSTFSVVRNPADRVPLWSCFVITAGLLIHFTQKLVRHVRTESWRRSQ